MYVYLVESGRDDPECHGVTSTIAKARAIVDRQGKTFEELSHGDWVIRQFEVDGDADEVGVVTWTCRDYTVRPYVYEEWVNLEPEDDRVT